MIYCYIMFMSLNSFYNVVLIEPTESVPNKTISLNYMYITKHGVKSRVKVKSVDEYVTHLHYLACLCNFCSCLQDSPIHDRIVLGIHGAHMPKRLLQQGKLSLQKCINICCTEEASTSQIKLTGQQPKEESINKVTIQKKPKAVRGD